MSNSVICFADEVEVPLDVRTLKAFRRWAFSKDFPEHGRIDYIGGRIEVDMSPERAFSHGTPKVELIRVLANLLEQRDFGMLFSDRMRVTSLEADLSTEPDLVLVTYKSLEDGRVALGEPSHSAPGDFLEIQGGPDLVVEIVSPSSIRKDTRDLPRAYFAAGVREYWLVDALGDEFHFQIYARGRSGFAARRSDRYGFQKSGVLGGSVSMEQRITSRGLPSYRVTIH
jgi:Uma2 family endonuclease